MNARFVPYEQPERPACVLCGPTTRKRAVFFDALRKRPLCAMCMVEALTKTERGRRKTMSMTTRRQRLLKAAGVIGLVLALVAPASAQDVTVRWPTRPGVDAYAIQGQAPGTTGWAQVTAVNAKDCPPVPGECSVSFPVPTVATCYRVLTLNLFGSRASRFVLCHDPAAQAPPPLETLGGSAGTPTP